MLTVISWVERQVRPISLRQLTFFGRKLTQNRLLESANYVRMELPTRSVCGHASLDLHCTSTDKWTE